MKSNAEITIEEVLGFQIWQQFKYKSMIKS